MRAPYRLAAILTLVLLSGSSPALAHEAVPGIQGVIGAVPHILTEPAQALLVMALSLWNGQGTGNGGLRSYGLLALPALLTGAISVLVLPGLLSWTGLLALAFTFLLGLAAAARLSLPRLAVALVITTASLFVGRLAMPDPGPLGAMIASGLGALIGATVLGLAVFALARWCVAPKRPAPFGVAVRVAGSWIAAASLMAGALVFTRL